MKSTSILFSFFNQDETFTLANQASSGCSWVDVEQSGESHFVAAGVHLSVLEPMRRWRVLFNGMLRLDQGFSNFFVLQPLQNIFNFLCPLNATKCNEPVLIGQYWYTLATLK
jgi:hypothetical protein